LTNNIKISLKYKYHTVETRHALSPSLFQDKCYRLLFQGKRHPPLFQDKPQIIRETKHALSPSSLPLDFTIPNNFITPIMQIIYHNPKVFKGFVSGLFVVVAVVNLLRYSRQFEQSVNLVKIPVIDF